MRFSFILISTLAISGGTAFADDDLEFAFGPVTTTVIQGHIGQQKADAVIVSSGADSELPYATVTATPTEEGSGYDTKYILSIAELKADEELNFTSVEAVRRSTILAKDDKRKLEKLINTNAQRITTVRYLDAEDDPKDLLDEVHKQFTQEYDLILENYAKQLSFSAIALGVRNALIRADELSLHSLNVPTLGYGVRKELCLTESVAAILTGVRLYELQAPHSKEHDVRIIVNERANPANRKKLIAKLSPALHDGDFVDNAARSIRHSAIGALPKATVSKSTNSIISGVTSVCRKLLSTVMPKK